MNDATPSPASTRGALLRRLEPELARRHIVLDPAQQAALARLQRLYDELVAFKRARASLLQRWLNPPVPPRGVYLWGGVGRGKSFLMDAFYRAVPIRRKTRVHFHAFMRDVHEELKTLKREEDPLSAVAARLARRHRLVCFDEFHVSDVADAMILGRLLTAALRPGCGIRDDLELSTRRSVPGRPAAAESIADHRPAQAIAGHRRGRWRHRLPPARARDRAVLLHAADRGGRSGAGDPLRAPARGRGGGAAADHRIAYGLGEKARGEPGMV